MKAGDSVLVHAAVGGLGLLLYQALRDRDALVVGATGGREKCDLALQHGADHMIDYREEINWAETVRELTNRVFHLWYQTRITSSPSNPFA